MKEKIKILILWLIGIILLVVSNIFMFQGNNIFDCNFININTMFGNFNIILVLFLNMMGMLVLFKVTKFIKEIYDTKVTMVTLIFQFLHLGILVFPLLVHVGKLITFRL